MRERLLALAPAALALLLYYGAALPLRARAAQATDEHRMARRQRQEMLTRLAALERREAAVRQASAAMASLTGGDEVVRAVRRAVVALVSAAGVEGVRLAVRPARPPLAATVSLAARGRFPDVLALSGQVGGPETGLVLSRTRLAAREGLVTLDVEATALGPRP
jgi:hypothetical protein